MFPKVFLLIAVLRAVSIRSDDCIECSPLLKEIQTDILNRTAVLTQISWNKTAPGNQNVYFSPLITRIRFYMYLMQLYYNSNLKENLFRDKYLEKPYALASVVEKLQRLPNVEMKINMVIFYDERYTPKDYVTDVQTHYHAETHQIPFEPKNEQRIRNNINGWLHVSTKGREQWVEENFQVAKKSPYQKAMLTFTGCWDTPKTVLNSIGSEPQTNLNRHRRFSPPVPKFPTFELNGVYRYYTDVKAFSAKEKVGYYDNAEKQYEAIRIPFRGNEFFMAVLLPYYESSLALLKTFTDADFRQMLRGVSETNENVHYTMPMINSTTFYINENGASVLGEKEDLCNSPAGNSPGAYQTANVDFKTFQADRPFAVVVYHHKTALVLEYALVRNSSSSVWTAIRPKIQVTVLGEEKDVAFST